MTGATDGPGVVAILRPMETLTEYLERRKAVRDELTADDGGNDWCVMFALGKVPPIAPPPKTMLYSPNFMRKKQAD